MDIQHCWIARHCLIIFPAKCVLPLSLCWIFVLDFFDVRFRIQHCWIPVVHPLSIQCWIFVLDFFDVRFRICELSQCQSMFSIGILPKLLHYPQRQDEGSQQIPPICWSHWQVGRTTELAIALPYRFSNATTASTKLKNAELESKLPTL